MGERQQPPHDDIAAADMEREKVEKAYRAWKAKNPEGTREDFATDYFYKGERPRKLTPKEERAEADRLDKIRQHQEFIDNIEAGEKIHRETLADKETRRLEE